MSEWKETKLQEIAVINPAERLAKGTKAKKVAMELLQPFTKKISTYSREEYKGGVKFRNGDTLVARITPSLENGKTSFVDLLEDDEVGFGSTEFIVLREIEGISDKNFLFYLACSPEFRDVAIASMTGSSGRQRVQTDVVKQHEFIFPPLPEQRAIASVLSSLDDKIDLLHRQNKTLEAMTETLFRQWFVEEADEGWEECTLNDLCTQVASGGTPSTKIESYYNGDINWYSTKELKDNFLYESENKITKEGLENSSAKLFPAGTIVIAIYAAPTVGRLGILANEASFNQAACGLIANEEICCSEFIYLYLKNQRGELNLMASGSAQQNLNVSKIKSYPAFKIPKDLMNKFKDAIQPNFKKININTLQIRTLEKLRDTLLPKLMSGEVRVEYEGAE